MARLLQLQAALLLACCASGADAAAAVAQPHSAPGTGDWLSQAQHVARRLKVTAHLWWARAAGAARATPRRSQATPPAAPDACNPQYDSQQSFDGEQTFQTENGQCINDFATCLMQDPTNTTCNGYCTASIDVLQSTCDNTYCEINGDKPAFGQQLPWFSYRSADCLPDNCDASQHDAQQSYYRGQLCGALWSTPDCASITLSCAYDLSSNTIWIIVGSIVGFFVLVMTVLVAWWCIVKRRLDAERAQDGYASDEEQEGEYETMEGDTVPLRQSDYTTGGVTYVNMPRRPGDGNEAVLNSDEAGL